MPLLKNLIIRRILNSAGKFSLEAEVLLGDGSIGIGSGAVAIAKGRRERPDSDMISSDMEEFRQCVGRFLGKEYDQASMDNELQDGIDDWGTDFSLSISLAFARACARSESISLVEYVQKYMEDTPVNQIIISPMVPVFSGGIHSPEDGGSMQQIMLVVNKLPFDEAIFYIRRAYEEAEQDMKRRGRLLGYSASSGLLVRDMTIDEKFSYMTELIYSLDAKEKISIGVDVAAEHLRTEGSYRFGGKKYNPSDFLACLKGYMDSYPVTYVEDPFDFKDRDMWRELFYTKGNTQLFADDLSATQAKYVDGTISDGVIVKMKQVGTLTGTLEFISEVRKQGMKLCVSHRSIETEDTFMCDLAVASGAEFIKIGGPRRGDRVEKYNRLLRILGF